MQFLGNFQGWCNTGIRIAAGDRLQVLANGTIYFAMGTYPRNPDGRDEQGKQEIAPANWPAGGKIRNSLCLRVGNWVWQGGSYVDVPVPVSGMLEITNNDDQAGDNKGFWNITFNVNPSAPGRLFQQTLFVVIGSNAINSYQTQTLIKDQINLFENFIYKHSKNQLVVATKHIALPGFTVAGYNKSNFPNIDDPLVRSQVLAAIAKQGLNPDSFNNIFILFDELYNLNPGDGGLTWGWFKFTAVPWYWNTHVFANNVLWEYFVHEYLHHIDYYFQELGQDSFINPDCRTGGAKCKQNYSLLPEFKKAAGEPLSDNAAFYRGCLQFTDTNMGLRMPNFRTLDARFGRWGV